MHPQTHPWEESCRARALWARAALLPGVRMHGLLHQLLAIQQERPPACEH